MVVACREKAQRCAFSVPFSSNGFLLSPDTAKSATGRFHPRFFLLRRCRLRAILAGFGMDTSFSVCTFLVVQLPPPNRRWEWRKNEPGPSRSQGWHDAYLHG